MYYVYLLQSQKNQQFYLGCTSDLKRRFIEHNNSQSIYTKQFRPWILVYYEAYKSRELALVRERQLKRFAKAFSMLKRRLHI